MRWLGPAVARLGKHDMVNEELDVERAQAAAVEHGSRRCWRRWVILA